MYLNYPQPANWQDFETLTLHIVEKMCEEGTSRHYGRQGQRQNGVDIYGRTHSGKHLGVQCKQMQADKLLKKQTIEDEADKALKFKPKLDQFIIATTLPNDVAVHDAVVELNDSGKYGFTIDYWSWSTYLAELNSSIQIVEAIYGQYAKTFGVDEEICYLKSIAEGFRRPALSDNFLDEVDPKGFLDALSDMSLFMSSGTLYDRLDRHVVVKTFPSRALPAGALKKMAEELRKDIDSIRQAAAKDLRLGQLDRSKTTFYNQRRYALFMRLNAELSNKKLKNVLPVYPPV